MSDTEFMADELEATKQELASAKDDVMDLRAALNNATRELKEIANMCDAPHWTTDRRYRIRDKAINATTKAEALKA